MNQVSRRAFLKSTAGAVTFAVTVAATPQLLARDERALAKLLPILRFDENGKAVLGVPVPDMGQGMITCAAQLVADELDIALDNVSVELMPFVGKVNEDGQAQFDLLWQSTGGSLATGKIWIPFRQAAGYMRSLLIDAAARAAELPFSSFSTEDGQVIHNKTGKRIPYGVLVDKISPDTAPDYSAVVLKKANQRKCIGKDQRNVAAPDIVTGKPIFGLDQDIPNMLHVAIRRCPHLKGELVSHNGSTVRSMPEVRHIVEMPRLPEDLSRGRLTAAGVAVVADSYWAARRAADALVIIWDGSYAEKTDSTLLRKVAIEALDHGEMEKVVDEGNFAEAIAQAKATVEATYHIANWAHACMEPHSCIADVRDDTAEFWCGHQRMDVALNAAANATKLPVRMIKANFYRMGTGFGRKWESDYIQEACFISKKLGRPVKVTWSREDEIEQDFVNHLVSFRVRGSVDNNNRLNAMHVRVAADAGNYSGGAQEIPCGLVDNYIGEWSRLDTAITNGAWRAPGNNTRSWATSSFLDEMAHEAGVDPLEFLLALYRSKPTVDMRNWPNLALDLKRHVALLEKVAMESGYGKSLSVGRGQGVAIHHTHHSLGAHVVEISMNGDSDFTVEKVTSAIDCGLAVNPLGIRAQMESGIIDGLCTAKYGNMIFEHGVPTTNNFDTYHKMRMDEAPKVIDIHIMDFGDDVPRGTGETSLPPFIPALTNAIFAASGKRVRTLPISENL